ncbi:class I mannose-6-phosphate isomerase [Amycolatopsis sp. NPDC049868]|uniref:class I mannose-6-phosphate isomerase n=1 Tax=Amycolatopsis sp. NPDC049868 TaxID=3363934 RepID=UPI0037AE09A8
MTHSRQFPQAIVLPANQPRQFYRGGASIAELRDNGEHREFGPEDWIASTTTRFGHAETGLTPLPDGRWLRDAVRAEPMHWLGPEHVAFFGDSTALLVKLIDAGQRLPVHCHPSDVFARRHLGSRFGKTEAWIVLGSSRADAKAYLGFRDDVTRDVVDRWVATQDSSALLGSLNEIPVKPGDTVHVPAGVPHALGPGIFMIELQQPTDLSITLEWDGFLADAESAFLGMDQKTALEAVQRRSIDESVLTSLIKRTASRCDGRVPLLSEGAAPFFRADRLHDVADLEPSFGVLVVTDGFGRLSSDRGDELALKRGMTVVVPHAAGAVHLEGELVAVHCRPPLAAALA